MKNWERIGLLMFVVLCVAFLLAFGGCGYKIVKDSNSVSNVKPIESFILAEPNDWKKTYGEIENSQFYFNIAVTQAVVNRQAEIIKGLVADTNDLKARLSIIETVIEDMNN